MRGTKGFHGRSWRGLFVITLTTALFMGATMYGAGPVRAADIGGFIGVPQNFDLMAEADCRECHEDQTIVVDEVLPNRHHLLLNETIPSETDAPYGSPGENYECLSCHALEFIQGEAAFEFSEFRDCVDCHQQKANPQNTVHHRSSDAQTGDCTYCHSIPVFALDRPAQAACRECHGAFQHDNGGPILDFGACVSCHNDSFSTARAPIAASSSSFPTYGVPRTFHAAPPRAVGYTRPAPGKGSFNLFWAQFTNNGQDQEDTFLENIEPNGDDMDDEGGFRFSRPKLNFALVRIKNKDTFYNVPKFPDIVAPSPGSSPGPGPSPGDNAPSITIESPNGVYNVSGNVGIRVKASDDLAVKKVYYWVDQGSKISMSGPDGSKSGTWSASWDSRYVAHGTQYFSIQDGSHVISIQAEDNLGKVSTKSISVQVQNNSSYYSRSSSGGYDSSSDDDSRDD